MARRLAASRPAAVAAGKDVIPANHSKGRALALLELVPLEQVLREGESELVAEEEVSIPASIRATALKARKSARVELKLAPTFKAGVLKAIRPADKALAAEKAVARENKLKNRCRVERKAAREARTKEPPAQLVRPDKVLVAVGKVVTNGSKHRVYREDKEPR
jgi:hypothetical protein